MKKNKIKLLGLSAVLVVAMAGCRPANTNMRNMSTQTRLNDNVNNRWMTNTPFNTRDRLNTNLNNGMVRNNTYLNDNMVRNTPMTNDSLGGGNVLAPGTINNGRLNTNLTTTNTALVNRANKIAQRVSALPEVNAASVVIHGNTAIVGCDVKGSATNAISSNLRQKVEAAVKTADKNVKNISVTSDPTLYNRIRTMSTNISNGHPISTFVGDIEDVMRRIAAPFRTTPVR